MVWMRFEAEEASLPLVLYEHTEAAVISFSCASYVHPEELNDVLTELYQEIRVSVKTQ